MNNFLWTIFCSQKLISHYFWEISRICSFLMFNILNFAFNLKLYMLKISPRITWYIQRSIVLFGFLQKSKIEVKNDLCQYFWNECEILLLWAKFRHFNFEVLFQSGWFFQFWIYLRHGVLSESKFVLCSKFCRFISKI